MIVPGYIDEEEPCDYSERLSIEMLPFLDRYPRSDVIAAPHLLWDWNPELVAQILTEQLTPRRAKVTLVSTAFVVQGENSEAENKDDQDDDDEESHSGSEEDGSEGSDGSDDDDDEEEEESEVAAMPAPSLLTADKIASLYIGPEEWLSLVMPPVPERSCLVEPHFGTQYWEDILPESLYLLWESSSANATLHLPPPNPFIPTDLSLISVEASEGDVAPERLFIPTSDSADSSTGALLWHLPDVAFSSPKVEICIRLASEVSLHSALSALMLDVLCRMLCERVNEELYMASMADLDCHISTVDMGLLVKVSGFSNKACLLASSVVAAAMSVGSAETWKATTEQLCFARVKEQLLQCYQNANMTAGHTASNGRLRALKPSKFSSAEKASVLEGLGVASETHLTDFRELFWKSINIECLVHGNITKPAAVSMMEDILAHHAAQKWISPSTEPAFRATAPAQPITQIPANSAVVLRQVPDNAEENNSCVEVYFQFGEWTVADVTRLDLLEQLIGEPFFDDLRTKQQVKYCDYLT